MEGRKSSHSAKRSFLVFGRFVQLVAFGLGHRQARDWIIDLGPEGGSGGGTVVAEGPPEHVATVTASHTGQFLAPILGIERG